MLYKGKILLAVYFISYLLLCLCACPSDKKLRIRQKVYCGRAREILFVTRLDKLIDTILNYLVALFVMSALGRKTINKN